MTEVTVARGEICWLIEQTSTEDGSRRFWNGYLFGWDAMKAARYPEKNAADRVADDLNGVEQNHGPPAHGRAEVCEHMFQCGPDQQSADLLESLARHVVELERQLADAESTNYREYSAALERIKELERQLADHAHFQRFFDKYALGSKTVPSCLVCGKAGWPPGIHHGDLPGIVVCVPCANAPRELANAQESARKNAVNAARYEWLRDNHDAEVVLAADDGKYGFGGAELDTAIDAARAAGGEHG